MTSTSERNAASRARLRSVGARLSDADLRRSVDGEWTVAAHLYHVAFWDRATLARWKDLVDEGTPPASVHSGPVNAAAMEDWLARPAEAAVDAAVRAADALDGYIDGLTPEQAATAAKLEMPRMLDRAPHREEHLDAVERALGAS